MLSDNSSLHLSKEENVSFIKMNELALPKAGRMQVACLLLALRMAKSFALCSVQPLLSPCAWLDYSSQIAINWKEVCVSNLHEII